MTTVYKWDRFELKLESAKAYSNPLQEATLQAVFSSPTGERYTVDGFWDGGQSWRIRFAPNRLGQWTFKTICSDSDNSGLHNQTGEFDCEAPTGMTCFQQHGPIQLSETRHFLAHADGTPFFWLADTAWNGPLKSTEADWDYYVQARVSQKFTAVQWVATQWIAAPDGDGLQALAYTGNDSIQVNPAFFQRLDKMLDALNEAGLLGAPVMFWAAQWGDPAIMAVNPGIALPEAQAILLGRYMKARWGANQVVWILNGDGNYKNAHNAERWKQIGRGIFGDQPHAPVSLHPGGLQWNMNEFRDEPWLDIIGYQSNHADSPDAYRWMLTKDPATDWKVEPYRPIINLEPCYEYHLSLYSKKRFEDYDIRRAIYWSLLVSPTAGVTYGGHGVWAWDDGTATPVAHPDTGIALPWQKALFMPGAEQMQHLYELFTAIEWWGLEPHQELLDPQPYDTDPAQVSVASRSTKGDLAIIYVLENRIRVKTGHLARDISAQWFNPRTGEYSPAPYAEASNENWFDTPEAGDWILLFSMR